ncbi:hypothetical protein V2A60_003808 [Cordyceps javanica]
MPGALSEGEVIVTLSCLAPTALTFPQRRLLLSNQRSSLSIGRASKRSSTLESRMYNAWIDAPVMSRQHAELKLDSQSQTVFIRDVGSLHGTFHNDIKLRRGQSQALHNGDLLKFGISIDRGHEVFPQCTMRVGLEFAQPGQQAAVETGNPPTDEATLPQPTVFQVPDDSESEDMDFEDDMDSHAAFSSIDDSGDDPTLQTGAAILAENSLDLVEFRGFDTTDPIDLTSEPDLISEDNLPSSSSPLSDNSKSAARNTDYTLNTVELDDLELGTLDDVSVTLPSDGFAPALQVKHGVSPGTTYNNVPGMDGPLSEDQHLSASSEITPLMITRAKSLGELSGKLEYFIAREQNKLHLQHAITPLEFQPEKENLINDATKEQEAMTENISRKRKADEISDSGPRESQPIQSTNLPPEALPQDMAIEANVAASYKRVKTAAEYVGIMAIGGIAVMTALIATAPTF